MHPEEGPEVLNSTQVRQKLALCVSPLRDFRKPQTFVRFLPISQWLKSNRNFLELESDAEFIMDLSEEHRKHEILL